MAKSSFTPFAAALSDRMGAAVDRALLDIGVAIETTAQESIKEFGIPRPNHVVSTPGDPPNADTHRLDRSIRSEAVVRHAVRVTATAPYSAHLEYGTVSMEARPYMRPALRRNTDLAKEKVANAIASAVKG